MSEIWKVWGFSLNRNAFFYSLWLPLLKVARHKVSTTFFSTLNEPFQCHCHFPSPTSLFTGSFFFVTESTNTNKNNLIIFFYFSSVEEEIFFAIWLLTKNFFLFLDSNIWLQFSAVFKFLWRCISSSRNRRRFCFASGDTFKILKFDYSTSNLQFTARRSLKSWTQNADRSVGEDSIRWRWISS